MAGTAVASPAEKADVVFVFDRSDSMNENRYEIAREMEAIHEGLVDRGVDARYALVTYGETARTEQSLTADFGAIDRAMEFSHAGSVENASAGVLEATEMDFRPDASVVVVLVTDEDDDSSAARREEAMAALSGVRFTTVSPSDATTSSCENHSPPCDDDASNELRTMAEDVDGDWLDVADETENVVLEIGRTIAAAASGSSPPTEDEGSTSGDSTSDDSDFPDRADITTTDLAANRTTVEVGEPVAFDVTVENTDRWEDDYEAVLWRDDDVVAREEVRVPGEANRTVRLVHAFETPGTYEMAIGHERVAVVNVTPLGPTTVETTLGNDGSTLRAAVTDARANETVPIPLSNVSLGEGESVAVERLGITPTRDGDFQVEVRAGAAPPNGTTSLPAHVRPVTYLVANSSLEDGAIANVTYELANATEETYVYHYDEDASEWVPIDREVRDGTAGDLRLAATASGLSAFAVGVREPSFVVTDLAVGAREVRVGESVDATVTVENRGAADGTFDAALSVDGDVVATRAVSVPADGTRSVTLAYAPGSAGEHTLSVGDAVERTVLATAPATRTPTRTPIPTAESTTTGSPGQPGFGAGLAVAALLGLALLAGRRQGRR